MLIKDKLILFIIIIISLLTFFSHLHADEFNISAKEITFDKSNNVVIGKGQVEVSDKEGKIIKSDKVIYKKEFGFLTYPLSGGFRTWTLLPSFLYPLFLKIEKFLETYLARHVSFRMLVVLEKINVP